MVCGLLLAGTAWAAPPATDQGRLVSAKWLQQHQNEANLVLIDASPTQDYLKGHIKGAVSCSFDKDHYMSYGINTSYGGNDLINSPTDPLPWQDGPTPYIQQVMRSLGINNNSKVVVYDNGGHFRAARFYWTLTHNGAKDAYILDGGLAKWKAMGLPTVTEVAKAKPGDFVAKPVGDAAIATTDYILSKQFKPDTVLVYAVTPVWFYGPYQAYSKLGHIPGSVMVSYPDYFQKDKTWKSKEELQRLFASVGATPDKETICYCGGNPAASCLYFTLKHVLGYPKVRYYYQGSTMGWLDDPRDLPLHTYWNQHLLRDPYFVRWWGGKRIQYLVGDSQVLTVDVRSPQAYQAGHIPYAVNVPVSDLTGKLGADPAKWAQLLGDKGAADFKQLVIVDDTSTPNACLMFWLAEYMGRPKVSVLNGGMKAWQDHKLKVTDKPTVIAPAKTKYDVAIQPAKIKARPQAAVRLADAGQKPDFLGYPRVYINASANSAQLPFDPAGAKVVNIPAGKNFNEYGILDFASNLIKLYEDAGVYKQAEVVCYSDKPEEAAAAYYALRTLGYPKVMVYYPAK
ncbi:hypothetical protein FAK_10250 [Desulfoferula mesophila]|uniref:Rhodanese domain-containing protein n=2 Tax=Desulfoferula mesophila TaxID=3058419 RepID=A0AAU9EL90_9BACT|nr:hypothetical protein FAK_10250 [Desulfoferula mesophilus]